MHHRALRHPGILQIRNSFEKKIYLKTNGNGFQPKSSRFRFQSGFPNVFESWIIILSEHVGSNKRKNYLTEKY